jgi:hypothetical protein
MDYCNVGCYGFDEVAIVDIDIILAVNCGDIGVVIDGDLQTVFVVEDSE